MKKLIDREKIIDKQLSILKPEKFEVGDGRSTLLKPGRVQAVSSCESDKLLLNGEWKVSKWPYNAEEAELAAPAFADSSWDKIQQPGKVFFYDPELCPTGIKDWNRVTMAHIDPEDGAVIRREVKIPLDWKNKKIFLRFDAIYPAGRIYCNGTFLGEHLSGLTPVDWDVTDLVVPGETALVAVSLLRTHKYVQLDMPRHALEFTGINQDAYFHAVEPVRITEHHLISSLSDDLELGFLEGEVFICNGKQEAVSGDLVVSLIDLTSGEKVAELVETVNIQGNSTDVCPLELKLDKPNLWNDEYPNLYRVELELQIEGQGESCTAFNTGFRKFELKDQRALLNGNPVKFRGVNHLTFHPEYGMYTPKEWLRRSLELMKKANVNTIRTHFLSPHELVELCDELGIYLLQELPIDWGHTYFHDPDYVGPAMMRLDGGVRRDRHSPSLMVWSVGNENMARNMDEYDDFMNHLKIADELVKRLDPTRPTMFPPPGPANKVEGIFEVDMGDVADIHYSFKLIRKFNKTDQLVNPKTWEGDMKNCTRQEALDNGWSGVWFSSEYGIMDAKPDLINAPYGIIISDREIDLYSGENSLQAFFERLEVEWGYMRDDSTCLGGAYFPWLCAGAGNNPWGWVRWGEDADWGVVTADLLPKPIFWAMRVSFSPIRFPGNVVWDGSDNIEIELKNGYNSIDLKDCTLRTTMNKGGKYMTCMREWKDIPVSCKPGETVKVKIPIWHENALAGLKEGVPALCRCSFMDPNGFRPITADIIIIPPEMSDAIDKTMSIGPDAVF
jgi:hypothetical protein